MLRTSPLAIALVLAPAPTAAAANIWDFDAVIRTDARPELQGEVVLDRGCRSLTIHWRLARDGHHSTSTQVVPTGTFSPTAVAAMGGDLLVGGNPGWGNTHVERWSFDHPSRWIDGEAYEVAVTREVVYEDHRPGYRGVRLLHPLRGHPGPRGGALLQVEDSGDLYVLDLRTGVVTLAYTAAEVPALAHRWNTAWSADHPVRGHVYVLGYDDGRCGASPLAPLVLLDSRRRGTIDGWLHEPHDEVWAELGEPATWLRVFH